MYIKFTKKGWVCFFANISKNNTDFWKSEKSFKNRRKPPKGKPYEYNFYLHFSITMAIVNK